MKVEWTVEHDGTVESLTPWNLFVPVDTGTTLEFPVANQQGVNPLRSIHEFSRIWTRVHYSDDDLSDDYLVAVARLIR